MARRARHAALRRVPRRGSAARAGGLRHSAPACSTPAPASAGSLPYAPALARCYEAILDARFDDAETEIGAGVRSGAEGNLRADAGDGRLVAHPDRSGRQVEGRRVPVADRRGDRVGRSLGRARAETGRRVVLRGRVVRPARAVPRAARRAPRGGAGRQADQGRARARRWRSTRTLQDAYFGIGLYHYYADIVPAALKFLRWMLLLPGGNKVEGLQRDAARARPRRTAARRGRLPARMDLSLVRAEGGRSAEAARRAADGLPAQPALPPVDRRGARRVPARRRGEPRRVARAVRPRARSEGRAAGRERGAGAARHRGPNSTRSPRPTPPSSNCRPSSTAQPVAPYGAMALARYQLGAAFDRMGWRDRAVAAYQAAIASAPADDPDDVRTKARDAIARRPDPKTAEAYRLSIEGYRHLQRNELAQAAASLSRSAALNPADPLTTYRQALLLAARGRQAEALAEFERVIALRPVPPAFVVGGVGRRGGTPARGRGQPRARDRAVHARVPRPRRRRGHATRRGAGARTPPRPRVVALTARANDARRARRHFVLDIICFSPIIYMQYERGGINQRLVIPRRRLDN